MEHSTFLAHTAHRRLFCWDCLGTSDPVLFPNFQNFGWYDHAGEAAGWIKAESDVNEFGWVSKGEIQNYDILPVDGNKGVEVKMTLEHPASGHFITYTYEYVLNFRNWDYERDGNPNNEIPVSTVKSVDFPFLDVNNFEWAMSDCFLFPRQEAAPLDFAVFDGSTAYIKNRSRTLDTTGAWRQEFDIRLHGTEEMDYFCKSFNTTRFCRIRTIDIGWIGRFVVFTTPLPLDTWLHIDFRYQWDSADGLYRVSVDGAPDATAANTNFNAKLDQFGRRGAQTPRGEFDLRNFLFRNGTAASNVVYLDQKFIVNACDDGPDGRHGDTFNMTLPSCP